MLIIAMAMRVLDNMPRQVRVSIGSAIVIGLAEGKLETAPTTVYLMTYRKGKCVANCGFCPQAKGSKSRADVLSRISWPIFPTELVLNGLKKTSKNGKMRRVCIQALNYPETFRDLRSLIEAIHQNARISISISCQPLNQENIKSLADSGAERIGIPIDAATQELFDKIKGTHVGGPYDWKKQFDLLRYAVSVFGKGKVSTHLIVGLGETEEEMVNVIQQCVDMGVIPALFAFTPIHGTALDEVAQPPISSYRRVQIARYLITHGLARANSLHFSEAGHLIYWGLGKDALERILCSGKPFQTSGCPDCNRPYYNEKPSGPIYNYPRPLTEKELSETWKELTVSGA